MKGTVMKELADKLFEKANELTEITMRIEKHAKKTEYEKQLFFTITKLRDAGHNLYLLENMTDEKA